MIADNSETPRMVKSHGIHLDEDYADWITNLKQCYRSAHHAVAPARDTDVHRCLRPTSHRNRHLSIA